MKNKFLAFVVAFVLLISTASLAADTVNVTVTIKDLTETLIDEVELDVTKEDLTKYEGEGYGINNTET